MNHKSRSITWRLTIVLTACLTGAVRAEVKPAAIFTSHMVLQRGISVPIWGTAAAGETVKVSFAGETVNTTADDKGQWRVRFPAQQQNGKGRDLTIDGSNTVVFDDVVVGDVWLCSGQSNMSMPLNDCLGAKEDIAAANFPGIREFSVNLISCPAPPEDMGVARAWTPASPETVPGFTAPGFYFARKVHQETGIPIGLINASWGSSPIETWLSPEGVAAVPELAQARELALKQFAEQAPGVEPVDGDNDWSRLKVSVFWDLYTGYGPKGDPKSMFSLHAAYNGMIEPLIPYAIKGVLWYQGEGNGGDGEPFIWDPRREARKKYGVPTDVPERDMYFHKKRALIGGWRQLWGQGDFPFYFVQLASFLDPVDDPAGEYCWVPVREAQTRSLTIPNTGMAVAIDIGEVKNIHPLNKYDVGLRLALWALAKDYGKEDLVYSGPLYKDMQVEDGKIRVSFDHVGGGLMVGAKEGRNPTVEVKDGKLARFAIAAQDQVWRWADAKIDGDTVLVWSERVPQPVAVRYAWSMTPEGANLYNKEGLPASPFRTDNWE